MATKSDGLTAPQQIAELQRLKQASAAWLLGVNARTLRDRSDLQRAEDGTYDARELIRAGAKTAFPKLTDSETESCCRIADLIGAGVLEGSLPAIADTLNGLHERYANGGLAATMAVILDTLKPDIDYWRADLQRAPSAAECAEQARRKQAEEEHRQAVYDATCELSAVAKCTECGAMRRGGKWAKGEPEHGELTYAACCPKCSP